MTNSILRAVIIGVVLGAMFFFVPGLVLGIFVILVVVHILRFAFMGHGHYGHGYYGYGRAGYGGGCCESGYGYGRGYDRECGCSNDPHFGPEGPHEHHHEHGPMHGHLFHWADKIRNMSEEEYSEFKNKMDKGFRQGYWGRNPEGYQKCRCGEKNETQDDSTSKKEETIK